MFTRKSRLGLTAAFLPLLLIGPAQALTIVNNDAVAYALKVEEEGDEQVSRTMTIAAGESLELCEGGCTIELDNGARESFEGWETVELRDGGFVLAN